MNLSNIEKNNYLNLGGHSVICDKLDPILAVREALNMYNRVRQLLQRVEYFLKNILGFPHRARGSNNQRVPVKVVLDLLTVAVQIL